MGRPRAGDDGGRVRAHLGAVAAAGAAGAGECGEAVPIAAAQGVPEAKAKACIADNAGAEELQAMYECRAGGGDPGHADRPGERQLVAAGDWETLEPYLKDAGG